MGKINFRIGMFFCLLFFFCLISQRINAEESGMEIMRKSYQVPSGKDSISTLTFTFLENGKPEKKIVQKRAYKYYGGEKGFSYKVIMFYDYPRASKGTTFMGWGYPPESKKEEDRWIYLPDMRKVRKISEDNTGDFENSPLKSYDLAPRYPGFDKHKLLKTEELDGTLCYVIESIPVKSSRFYPYSKNIRWISKDNYLPLRVDSYNLDGILEKNINIKWEKKDYAWVWVEVKGTNVITKNKTVLNVSGIKLDVGLKDKSFSKRTLQRGVEKLFR